MTQGKHKATVTIDAKTESANRDIRKLTRRINTMERGLDKAARSARKNAEALRTIGRGAAIGAAAIAGAATALFRLAEASAESANNTAKAAKGLGVASDSLQRMEFAASRATKATSEQLHKAIATLTVGLQDAVDKGTGPVAEGLEQIGLSAADLVGLGLEDQFAVISTAMQKLPTDANRASASMRLFGKRAGSDLAPLFREGPAGLAALGDEAERLGLVLDDKALASSEAFVDSMSDLKQTVSAVARDVGVVMIPVFQDAAEGIKEWIVENDELIEQDLPATMRAIADGIGAVVTVVAEAVRLFNDAKKAAEDFGEALGDFVVQDKLRAAAFRGDISEESALASGQTTNVRGVGGISGAQGAAGRRRHAHMSAMQEFESREVSAQQWLIENRRQREEEGRRRARAQAEVEAANAKRKKDRKRGGGGGRRDKRSTLERMLEEDQDRMSAFSDDEPDLSFLQSGTVDPFDGAEFERVTQEQREAARVRREGLLQDELEHLEMRRAMGADPMMLLEEETNARLAHNDFLQEQAQTEAERLRLQNDRRRIYHEQEMARLQVEREQQKKRLAVYEEIGAGIDTVYRATATAALEAAFAQGQSVRAAVAGTAKAEALRATITASAALVQAAFWAAIPGGQPKAAQFLAVAGIAGAKAAAFGALAVGLGSGGGGRGGGGGRSAEITGASLGRGAAVSRPTASTPGSDSSVPGSPLPPPSSSTQQQSSAPISFSGATFNLYGAGGREDFIEGVTRDQQRLALKRR
jgi:hypothetical protein